MKKILRLALALALVLSVLCACGSAEGNQSKEKVAAERTEQNVTPLVQGESVEATFERIYESSASDGAFYIQIVAQNNTENTVNISLENASVNGEAVDNVMTAMLMNVKPGKASRNSFIISFKDISLQSVDEVSELIFDLVAKDKETGEEIQRNPAITLTF